RSKSSPGVNSISTEDEVELDARTSKKERKQEKKTGKDDLLIKENYRPIPDGEFELVPLGEDPTKGVKIGADLPDCVKRQLKACLRENAELFAWSAAEMPGIDPEVACHQLTIDPRASAVVQRRRKQSPEKAEAARKAVKDLLFEARVEFILQEIHEGINGQHIGGRSLARNALRAGYYWPTMQNDAKDHVLKCDKCQRHGDMKLAPANELKTMISPWPFAWWGMDILSPFPTAARQVKYLIVAVDYFTKWIEAEPLAKISASNILRFFKRDVIARFRIPQVVVTDNGTQFTN
ncbi:hypothetical protein TSUD_422870, partial [Trifolium subterraneum]